MNKSWLAKLCFDSGISAMIIDYSAANATI